MLEKEGKHEVQTRSKDETCQSNSLRKIPTLSNLLPDVSDKKSTQAVRSSKITCAFSSAPNIGVRLTDCMICGVSNKMSLILTSI